MAAASADREELAVAEVLQEVLRSVREGMPVFARRREELYALLGSNARELVTFSYKKERSGGRPQFRLLAEQEKAHADLVARDADGEVATVR